MAVVIRMAATQTAARVSFMGFLPGSLDERPLVIPIVIGRIKMSVIVPAAIPRQRRGGMSTVIAASAFPPLCAGAMAIFSIGADHLHEHGMIVTADLELGLYPAQRIFGVVLPIIACHVDAGHGRIPRFVEPKIDVAVFGAELAYFRIVEREQPTVFDQRLVVAL